MKKEDRIKKLIAYCKELSRLNDLSKEKSSELQEMARLARAGMKDSEEFKKLEWKHKHPTVIDFGTVVSDISRTVKYL